MSDYSVIDPVIFALEDRLEQKKARLKELHEETARRLRAEEIIDQEIIMINTTINYLKNHCRNTLVIEKLK
jgi:hypothetical protein